MNIDDRLDGAVRDLRDRLDHEPIPTFVPGRSVPVGLAAAVAVVALFVGAAAYAIVGNQDEATSAVVVASPGRDIAPDDGPAEAPAEAATETPAPAEVAPTESDAAESVPVESALASYPEPTRLTSAEPGQYFAPLPGASAWNADGSLLLLYRTGTGSVGHVIIDPDTRKVVADLSGVVVGGTPGGPADIELIYWNPAVANEVVWLTGTSLIGRDVFTGIERVVVAFDACDSVTSGALPSPPSRDGTIAAMCTSGASVSMVIADIASGALTQTVPFDKAIEALVPSPSGELIAIRLANGDVSVLAAADASEIAVGLDDPSFVWVVLADGEEVLALASYDDETHGTMVMAHIESDSMGFDVIVGPDAGDEYPPSSTHLTATTALPGATGAVRVVATVRGPASADSPLTGQVIVATFNGPDGLDGPTATGSIITRGHDGANVNDPWSTNTVSINATGTRLIWASDQGTDSTDTFIWDLSD